MPRKIDISHRTVIFIFAFILGLWVLYHVLDLILLIFVALILMSAISPIVSFLSRNLRLPKVVSILLIYIVAIALVGTLLTLSFTPLIEQTSKLALTLPQVLENWLRVNHIQTDVFQSELSSLSRNVLTYTLAFFSNVITIAFILVLTFYLSIDRENLEERLSALFAGSEERVKGLVVEIEEKLGAWFRGQLVLSFLIGASVYLGLTILQIPYALPLAILAGIFEVIPMIGPILAAIPAVVLAFAIAPVLAAGVAAMYFVIQQLENHIVVPQVMNKAVGLNPLVVILAIAVGGRLLGLSGALLAVPITVVLQILVLDLVKSRKE